MPNGCRIWQDAKESGGYGVFELAGHRYRAHRVACQVANGPAPFLKRWALHSCHTPSCAEGSHLRWGSAYENVQDTITAGHFGGRPVTA